MSVLTPGKKLSGSRMICKINLEKAFDKVDWSFLKWILIEKGFQSRWINWIMGAFRIHGTLFLLMEHQKVFFVL